MSDQRLPSTRGARAGNQSDSQSGDDAVEKAGPDRGRALCHVAFNALLALGCAVLFWRSESLPSSMWEPLGSGSFPRLVLGTLIGFNLMLMGQQLRVLARSRALPARAVRDWLWQHRLVLGVAALFLCYVVGIHWLGFSWASLAFLLLTQALLGARSLRALALAAIIALAFSFGLNALFGQVFNILLPTGALG